MRLSIPSQLQTFSIGEATDALVYALPHGLSMLCIAESHLSVNGMAQLAARFSALEDLRLQARTMDAAVLLHLPPGLITLRLEIYEISGIEALEGTWHQVWPKRRLIYLALVLTKAAQNAPSPDFWTSFPQCLRSLTLEVMNVGTHFPTNLSFLPRRLSTFSLKIPELDGPEVTDEFFNCMPLSLASFDLTGGILSVTHNMLLKLPKLFSNLTLSDSLHAKEILYEPANNDVLWSFIDQLPRFLFLSRQSTIQSGWATRLLQRQYDDMVAGCPNVAFDMFQPNQYRPFGTPKHRNDIS